MAWSVFDFILFGALLAGVSLALKFVFRSSINAAHRAAMILALATAVLLFWINGAVGIIGSENNDANLMYYGVLAIGVIGALAARLRPKAMSIVMFAVALAQAAVTLIALMGFGAIGPKWPYDVLLLNGFFVSLWLASAWLFRKTAWTR